MGRSGITKYEVRQARQALLARGVNPTVDALRTELGNTGSKGTIHRYMKELDDEGDGRRAKLSEQLQTLVEQLAGQLEDEAQATIEQLRAEHARQQQQSRSIVDAAQAENAHLKRQLERAEVLLQSEKQHAAAVTENLIKEQLARNTAEQRVQGLEALLAESEKTRESLDDKHEKARADLEHYRSAAKEQRDQDLRRHEQQVQQLQSELRIAEQNIAVKRDEITGLNQEGARLVAELSHARAALLAEQDKVRSQEKRLQELQAAEHRYEVLSAHVTEREAQSATVQEQLAAATARGDQLASRVRELELALAQAAARAEAQQSMVAELRTYLEQRSQPGSDA